MPKVVVPVRLDEAMIARIDGTGVGRSVFIRQAIRVALGDKAEGDRLVEKARSVKKPETGNPGTQPQSVAKPKTQPPAPPVVLVRDALRERSRTERQLADDLGMSAMLVSKCLGKLPVTWNEGLVHLME